MIHCPLVSCSPSPKRIMLPRTTSVKSRRKPVSAGWLREKGTNQHFLSAVKACPILDGSLPKLLTKRSTKSRAVAGAASGLNESLNVKMFLVSLQLYKRQSVVGHL